MTSGGLYLSYQYGFIRIATYTVRLIHLDNLRTQPASAKVQGVTTNNRPSS